VKPTKNTPQRAASAQQVPIALTLTPAGKLVNVLSEICKDRRT
jgi:hypothetical protein